MGCVGYNLRARMALAVLVGHAIVKHLSGAIMGQDKFRIARFAPGSVSANELKPSNEKRAAVPGIPLPPEMPSSFCNPAPMKTAPITNRRIAGPKVLGRQACVSVVPLLRHLSLMPGRRHTPMTRTTRLLLLPA
jgi:hypothetical protein